MPLFGGSKRPKLDGLTHEEEKRRDSLNDEVLRRAGESGVGGQAPAAVAVLRERSEAEESDFLWACLLGWQLMSIRHFAQAIEAFVDAISRDALEVRGHYGAGTAYYQAAEAKLDLGSAATEEITPANLTVDNLYHEAQRSFKRASELTSDRSERDVLRDASSTVEKALDRKAGRM